MHAILSQVSGLIGLLVFLVRVWKLAPIESAIFTAVSVALAMYLTLTLSDVAIRWIINQNPSQHNDDTTSPDLTDKTAESNRKTEERSRSDERALAGAAA